MLSIIIPTLNEEKYLPILLTSIKNQSFKDYEIIVSDNFSKDKTRLIAKKYGCRVIDGGLPAKARNEGAKNARGEFLLFLDADTILPSEFLRVLLSQQRRKNFDIASVYLRPENRNIFDNLLCFFMNIYFYLLQQIWPHASGMCIFARKKIHDDIDGFNHKIKLGEDHDYVIRASRKGKFSYLLKPYILFSIRRLSKEGRLGLVIKYIYSEIYRLFNKEIKKDIFEYEFGKHE
ncbi:glycosyltransferase [Candidatus Woesearchaeota archaeon]|nr:glycosyltransferase [Candidatus Woesearchaeota archaeon]